MPEYRFRYNGINFTVEAKSKTEAIGKARLRAATDQMVRQVQLGAKARSEAGLDNPLSPEFQALREQGALRGTAEAGPTSAAILGSAALGPIVSGALGETAAVASGVPILGRAVQAATSRPGAAVIGAVEEGIRTGDPVEAAKGALLGYAVGRTRGPVGRTLGLVRQAEMAGATQAPVAAAAPVATAAPATVAAAETTVAAPTLASRLEEIAAKILQWKKNGWSGAQMESALRNTEGIPIKDGREFIKRVLDAAAGNSLQAERVQVGAQNVARTLGTTKEEVRKLAGPVLDEALGEASPVLPRKAIASIAEKIKSLPMSERDAYVRKATSGKAMWNVEVIRRTLESMGLLLPAGVAARTAAGE